MSGCVLTVGTVWDYSYHGVPRGKMFLVVMTESPEQDREWLSRQLQIGNPVSCWRFHLHKPATRGSITGEDSDEMVREVRAVLSWILEPEKCTYVRDWIGDPIVLVEGTRIPPLKPLPQLLGDEDSDPDEGSSVEATLPPPQVAGCDEPAPTPSTLELPTGPLTREGLADQLGFLISARRCRTQVETDAANRVLADFVIYMSTHGMIPSSGVLTDAV